MMLERLGRHLFQALRKFRQAAADTTVIAKETPFVIYLSKRPSSFLFSFNRHFFLLITKLLIYGLVPVQWSVYNQHFSKERKPAHRKIAVVIDYGPGRVCRSIYAIGT